MCLWIFFARDKYCIYYYHYNTRNTIITHGIQTTKSQHVLQSQYYNHATQCMSHSQNTSLNQSTYTRSQLSHNHNTVRPQPSLVETTCHTASPVWWHTCPLFGVLWAETFYEEAEHLAGWVDLTDELEDGPYVLTHIVLWVSNLPKISII